MFGIVINKQGYKVEFVSLNEDKTPQFYELKDGESIIEDGWDIANDMNKPQWNGSEWIDTEPLPPIEPPIQPPTDADKISILQQQLDELSEYSLTIEMKSLETEESVLMNSEYVLDLDTRLTNIENK